MRKNQQQTYLGNVHHIRIPYVLILKPKGNIQKTLKSTSDIKVKVQLMRFVKLELITKTRMNLQHLKTIINARKCVAHCRFCI